VHRKEHVACNFNSLVETEGRLKVTGSHVGLHSTCGNISETLQDRVIVTTDH